MRQRHRLSIFLVLLCALWPAAGGMTAERIEQLMLAGPFAAVSDPLIRMVDSGALADVAETVEFKIWKNPDQMRALALNGETHFIAPPTNVAAKLYNRGADLRLVNVSIWGVLWMVSRYPDLRTLTDFKGKEVAMPFRSDMPDLIFTELAVRQGMDPKKDFELRYVANPLDAMQLLIMQRVDHALLAEPAVSMALRKTKSSPLKLIAPDLYRSVNLQQEWGRVLQRESRIPQAGMAVINRELDGRVIRRFTEEYAKVTQWCLEHREEAGKLVAERIEMLTPEAVADSIAVSQFRHVPAVEARWELEDFFNLLWQRAPALIGGRMPDDGFYFRLGAYHEHNRFKIC